MLSQSEANYLKGQRLARVATASSNGVVEVSPVGFSFDGRYFWIGSNNQAFFPRTKRYKNIARGNNRIAIVIDDVESFDPWKMRGVKVRGTAEIVEHEGMLGKGKYIRITPKISVSWGIEPQKKDGAPSFSVKRW